MSMVSQVRDCSNACASDDNDDDDQIIEDNSHGQEGRPKSKIIQIERKAKTPRSELPPPPTNCNEG